jgi:hypothetical protein
VADQNSFNDPSAPISRRKKKNAEEEEDARWRFEVYKKRLFDKQLNF